MCMQDSRREFRQSRSPSHITALRRAASKRTGPKRRACAAEMPWKSCGGTPLLAEPSCGWGRQTVALGVAERRTGSMGLGAPSACSGRNRWDDQPPQAAAALRHLAEAPGPHAPPLRTRVPSTRLTAHAALHALRDQGERAGQVPAPSTRAAGRKRRGFRLRQGVQATPPKKSPAPDASCAKSKNQTPKRGQRAASTECVSLVPPLYTSARGPAAVSPVATTKPVSTSGAVRRRMSRVGAWRKSAPSRPSPLAAPTKPVTASWRHSQPRGPLWLTKKKRPRVGSSSPWTTVRRAGAGGPHCSSVWGRLPTTDTSRCSCGLPRLTTASLSRWSGAGVSWSGRGRGRR
jgi:hypothetical protein